MAISAWSGHWHGYGPWTGGRAEYAREELRRPGHSLHRSDSATQTFVNGSLPPVQTGHALLRPPDPYRTWIGIADALDWLGRQFDSRPPADGHNLDLVTRLAYAKESLSGGNDVVWAYYTQGYSLTSYEVICCPNRYLPRLPCPRPAAAQEPQAVEEDPSAGGWGWG